MRQIDAFVSEIVPLALEILLDGVGVTGQTPLVKIKRKSDGYYWTGTVWQSGVATISCPEYQSSYFPGLYRYLFTLLATAETYYIAFTNTGDYALDDFAILTGRLLPVNIAAPSRSSTSPASATLAEKIEEIHGAVCGEMQMDNSGTAGRIKQKIKNYSGANVIKENDILKPAGTVITNALDTNAMAGRTAST
jgi:hypothetical protein